MVVSERIQNVSENGRNYARENKANENFWKILKLEIQRIF